MNRRVAYLAGMAVLAAMALLIVQANRGWLAPAGNAGNAAASPAPGDQSPATGPSNSLLPREYAFLQTRTPFGHARGRGGKGLGGPEASFVFKGVVQAGTGFTAFIEDLSAKNVVQAAVGDQVARGTIKSIDLDAIEYELAGDSRRIEVGQNLNGEAVQPAPATQPSNPPAANTATSPSPGQDGNAPPNPQAQPGPRSHG
ncbi:MAG: hypothetical protein ABSB42_18960 [Tepidisphaeraceae bacterium]|jgi:hypothetical protein